MKCEQTGKEMHTSRSVAVAHAKHLSELTGCYDGHLYHCQYCGTWHVGRQKNGHHNNEYGRRIV